MLNKPENFHGESIARLRMLGMMAAMGVILYPAESGSENLIPFCNQLRADSFPDKPPFLHGKEADGEVVCIVDGDTYGVKLDDGSKTIVRPWGLDCDESNFNDKCMESGRANCADEVKRGKKVAQKVRQVLSENRRVTLEPPFKDNGNRLLAYISIYDKKLQKKIDFGRQLVGSCLCKPGYSNKREKDYQRAAHNCSR